VLTIHIFCLPSLKIDSFLAQQAISEENWIELGSLIMSHFGIKPVPFDIKYEVPPGRNAIKAVLVLVNEHQSYSFLTTGVGDIDKPIFYSWAWKDPLSRDSNYLLIV